MAYTRGILGEQPSCDHCPLKGQKIVPPEGNPEAKIAIVGEGAGAEETRWGRPFIGKSGELLNQLLVAANLRREDVWITNSALCQPKGSVSLSKLGKRIYLAPNKTKAIAAKFCRLRLLTELKIVNPDVIVPLGGIAFEGVSGQRRSIQAIRGSVNFTDLDVEIERAWKFLDDTYRKVAEAKAGTEPEAAVL